MDELLLERTLEHRIQIASLSDDETTWIQNMEFSQKKIS
jgi:hypothetical protein